MAQRWRADCAGSWHHVMNRGIARRTVFESRQDMRMFLAALACEVRRGRIQIHAHCLLPTHFHLLVYSPRGCLGEAMKRALNRYVRYFNRTRKRDGSLFRGRFRSRPIHSLRYRRAVVRYIDANAVHARLAGVPHEYEHGSARFHATAQRPPWLATWWIDRELAGAGEDGSRHYAQVFSMVAPALAQFVEARLSAAPHESDPLDDLIEGAPSRVRAWMTRKARLADQTKPGLALCDIESIEGVVRESSAFAADASLRLASGYTRRLADVVLVGLLRDLGGLTYAAMARRIGRPESFCHRTCALHRKALVEQPEYAKLAATLTQAALARCH